MGGIVQSAMLVVMVVMEGHGSWKVKESQGMSWKVIEGLFLSSDCHFK